MNKWNIYVALHKSFCKELDSPEFYFKNVEIEDTANYLTLYDEDGTLAFRCHLNDVAKFVKYK
ncbi:hypothetical protein H8S37_04155 [Mediterraneibacter sp. NSJ-55]|uniref:Uncharacterized protein n=1 Tax=Mediterraneibacter hominis TaxID=2763054 RepID=A0A923RP77_9FIRM|nr:hypothetical protein [Mediterraneibacter hominis]MBC5688126.1 hypothetical protein [Mediterraneibacter hominis]